MSCQGVGPSFTAVDDAEGMSNPGAQGPQIGGGKQELAAGCDDIFYQQDTLGPNLGAFRDSSRAIWFGGFPNESAGHAAIVRQHGDHGDTAHFESGQNFGFGRNEGRQLASHCSEQFRGGFETVLVEILAGAPSGAQKEIAAETATSVDLSGEGL